MKKVAFAYPLSKLIKTVKSEPKLIFNSRVVGPERSRKVSCGGLRQKVT